MKLSLIAITLFLFVGSFTHPQAVQDNIEFVCMRKHIATKTCHYNFKVDGGKFRFQDVGCKYKKTDDVVEKVKSGEIALAKDWKIECPEKKEKPDNQ